jgi:predicted RND superfamily exporter protein
MTLKLMKKGGYLDQESEKKTGKFPAYSAVVVFPNFFLIFRHVAEHLLDLLPLLFLGHQ